MDEAKFWEIMGLLNWELEGDDDEVLDPVIEYLAKQSDEEIFGFDNVLARLLYNIDGQAWAKDLYGEDLENMSDDDFLYARCVAVVNGEDYYDAIKNRTETLDPDLEFEAVLYVAPIAWAIRNNADVEEYPHETEYSFETGSNAEQWSY